MEGRTISEMAGPSHRSVDRWKRSGFIPTSPCNRLHLLKNCT